MDKRHGAGNDVICRSYIDGRWLEDAGLPLVELGNPADSRETVSRSRHATPEQAAGAVVAAVRAWRSWRHVGREVRIAAVEALLVAIRDDRDALALAISGETGKTAAEAAQEVDATLHEARVQLDDFGAGAVETIDGNRILYEPLGAVLLVTPSNFPLACRDA